MCVQRWVSGWVQGCVLGRVQESFQGKVWGWVKGAPGLDLGMEPQVGFRRETQGWIQEWVQ